MPTILGRNYQLDEIHDLWTPYYNNLFTQFGNTLALCNFGDQPNFGKVNATTGTGRKWNASGLSPTWTPSEALSAFATPFDLTLASNWQGIAPVLTPNGTDEEMDTPDDAKWSRVESGSEVFSLKIWVKVALTAAIQTLFCKYDGFGGQAEYSLSIQADEKLRMSFFDDVDNKTTYRESDAALTTGQWLQLIMTYNSGSSALTAAGNDCTLYLNGVVLASSASNDADYSGMVAGTYVVAIGADTTAGTAANFLASPILGGPFGPAFGQVLLTAEQAANLWAVERMGVGV